MRLGAALCWLALLPALAAPPQWRLVWSDEFNGPPGTPPDPSKWIYDLGGGGWGNQELEVYTAGRANSLLDGRGNLVIQALESSPGHFTSARLKTQGKFSTLYGRVEARIKIPYGQSIWPAFWMLGANVARAGWPGCGEDRHHGEYRARAVDGSRHGSRTWILGRAWHGPAVRAGLRSIRR